MKKHNGMRRQDIVILLKLLTLSGHDWMKMEVAQSLQISPSEVSESLNRSSIGGLIDENHQVVMRQALLDFLQFGLRYVFPAIPGALTVGMPTAHSAPILANRIVSSERYVWPDPLGTERGQAIEPLYRTVAQVCRNDQPLYDLLALVDVFRVGRTREINEARTLLKERILL
jgi:hypothetical protein